MNTPHKAAFERLDWESPFEGVRHKYLDRNRLRLRLVEYSRKMPPHWCERGHYGYLIDGRMQIEYNGSTENYRTGDGIYIPHGPDHKHRATILSDTALVFFVEDA